MMLSSSPQPISLLVSLWLAFSILHRTGGVAVDRSGSSYTTSDVQSWSLGSDLEDLNIASNDIDSLTANMFSAYPSLHKLMVSWNKISSISPSAFQNTVLRTFLAESNRLSIFPEFTAVAGTIQFVRLRDNLISTIPSNAFANLNSLNTLELDGNLLSFFPDFSSLPSPNNFRNLYLSDNQIPSADAADFQRLTRIKILDLSDNDFEDLPDFQYATTLQHLYFTDNPAVDTIPDVFSGVPLRRLEVSGCNLSAIPNVPSVAHRLTTLTLENTHLDGLTNDQLYSAFAGMTALTTLKISGSGLISLPDIRDHMPLGNLKMSNLQLRCDCELAWLGDAQSNGVSVTVDANPCGSPPAMVGQPWASVYPSLQATCPGKYVPDLVY